VHRAMSHIDSSGPFDIMLSPQFYILKREPLPIRFHFQAKRLAPSILESLLPSEGSYEYFIFREEDGWAFIAYDPVEISEFLRHLGIAVEKISKVYFAQQAVNRLTTPLSLDKNEVLSNVQRTATVTPKILFPKETIYQDFSSEFRPERGKRFLESTHSVVSEKDTFILAAIFALFAIMFTIEGLRYRHTILSMQEKVSTLLRSYPALQSQYARANIEKKYRRIDREERRKREVLKGLSRLMLPGVQLEALILDGKHFLARLKSPDEKTVVRILSLAKEKRFKASRLSEKTLVKIEGEL